jgi:leucyl aminopeptidase
LVWSMSFARLLQKDEGQDASRLHLVREADVAKWRVDLPGQQRSWIDAHSFKAKPGEHLSLPGDGASVDAVLGVSDAPRAGTWELSALAARLPAGQWRLAPFGFPLPDMSNAHLGWLMAQHDFARYRKAKDNPERVLLTAGDTEPAIALAEATAMVRELVSTPASDMLPSHLAEACRALAARFDAQLTIHEGEALLEANYPTIHMVGRASSDAPRLIDLRWGREDHPKLTLIGKGVCFDSGGLDIKPAVGMLTMKKDMGGAAHAMALAMLVMRFGLPVRLRLLIPAVENAISGNAFRPGDIVRTRQGLSVEIGNTDAEGRLVLCDALGDADDEQPDLMIDFATLTGAARVALGPDLPALFTPDDGLADSFAAAARAQDDPLWRLPLWEPYGDMLASPIADINNSSESGFAGAITAALFLKRFVRQSRAWAHIDLFAWNASAKPGRPKGGEAMTLRACWALIRDRYRPAIV